MNSDKSPKKSSKESSRLSIDSNSTPPPNFQLPPEYWWNSSIPKNNLGSFDEDSQLLSNTPSGYIPDDGTFSPRPSKSKYTVNMQSHYPPSTLDWGEPSFDVDCSDDGDYSEGSIPQKIPMKNENNHNQNNIPAQNNVPAQDNDLQYQDIDIWDDNIVNQLHLSNSLFNDESSNHDAVYIHQKNVPAQGRSQSRGRSRGRGRGPATQNNNGQHVYKSLENAVSYWLAELHITPDSQSSYKSRIINFIRILDSWDITKPNQNAIDNYCDTYLKGNSPKSIDAFKDTIKQFFRWMSGRKIDRNANPNNIKNTIKINLAERTVTDDGKSIVTPKEHDVDILLFNFFNKWSVTLKDDINTKIAYQTYIINFIIYLTKISSFTPTVDDIKTFFKSNPELLSPGTYDECKNAIKSFLGFMGHMRVSQDKKVYNFLKSHKPIK